MSDELKQELENVRVLLEAKDDPAYAPLLPLFRVECDAEKVKRGEKDYCCLCCGWWKGEFIHSEDCELCGGSNYVTRLDWLDLPEGALAGPIAIEYKKLMPVLRPNVPPSIVEIEILRWFDRKSPNLAAVLALKEVLGG